MVLYKYFHLIFLAFGVSPNKNFFIEYIGWILKYRLIIHHKSFCSNFLPTIIDIIKNIINFLFVIIILFIYSYSRPRLACLLLHK